MTWTEDTALSMTKKPGYKPKETWADMTRKEELESEIRNKECEVSKLQKKLEDDKIDATATVLPPRLWLNPPRQKRTELASRKSQSWINGDP